MRNPREDQDGLAATPQPAKGSEGRDSSGNNNLNRKHLISTNSLSVFRYCLNFRIFRRQEKGDFDSWLRFRPTFPLTGYCALLSGKGFFLGLPLVSQKREKPFSIALTPPICANMYQLY